MVEKPIKNGVAYYFQPAARDVRAGAPVGPQGLGQDYAVAKAKADHLNAALDAWRAGEVRETVTWGTARWWFQRYRLSLHWRQMSDRHRVNQEGVISAILSHKLRVQRPGVEVVGDLAIRQLTPAFADKFYAQRHPGRERAAETEIATMKKAWNVVAREQPKLFGPNPFIGLTMVKRKPKVKPAASREDVYALARALREAGHPHLGAAALICFEWHQRPENVLAGAISWPHYRAGDLVTIEHWKTGETVDIELSDQNGQLYPELEDYLADLPRLGVPVVLRPSRPHGPYSIRWARDKVKQTREAAGLPDHLTLDACRHGGLTELGDAEVTEFEGMALSGHKTAANLRLYVKRTAAQRRSGARKRLEHRASGGQESE